MKSKEGRKEDGVARYKRQPLCQGRTAEPKGPVFVTVDHCLLLRGLPRERSFWKKRRIVDLNEDFCSTVEGRIKFVVLKGSLVNTHCVIVAQHPHKIARRNNTS